MIRKYSRFQTQEEAQFYEKLTVVILQILGEQDNQVPRYYIANILGYIKQINANYTPKTLKNLQTIAEKLIEMYTKDLQKEQFKDSSNSTKFKEDNYLQTPDEINNSSPDYSFRLLLGLSYSPNIPQIIINHLLKSLEQQGLAFFEKGVVIKILSQLMLCGIPINEDIANAIKRNRKITFDLSIREIYVFIYSFKDSNQDMGKLYLNFYYQVGTYLDNITTLSDFKQVVMIAKIHHYILTQSINEHKRIFVEKRTNQILNLITKSCTDQICREYLSDVIYISSLFIPYSNKLDFLFSKISKNIGYLKINSENRPLFTNFIMKILDKLQDKYDFFVNTSSMDIEFNDKLQTDAKVMLSTLIKKFIESKLLSFFLLTVQIVGSPNLLKQVLPEIGERRELIKNMTIQIGKVLGHENNKFGLSNLVMISQFLNQNQQYIQDQSILLRAFETLQESLIKVSAQQASSANSQLIWIYNLSNLLKTIENKAGEKTKGRLSEYFIKHVMQPICQNQVGVINEIVHEDGIVQYFNPNVNNGQMHNVSYLPSILNNLNIDIQNQPAVFGFLLPKMSREAKFWEGELLLNNLLCLHNLKMEVFEIFESACENLLSTLVYYQDTQEFQLNTDIYTSPSKLVDLLDAYSVQYKNHLIKNPNYQNAKPKRFVPLNILACFAFNNLSPSILESIFELMGEEQSIYFKPFVQLASQKVFDIQESQILQFNSRMPGFFKNKELSSKSLIKLLSNQTDQDSTNINLRLKLAMKEKFKRNDLTTSFLLKLQHDFSIDYFERLLQYLGMGSIVTESSDIELLIKFYNQNIHLLSQQSHLNMLKVVASYQIQQNTSKLILPIELQVHEPTFYKTVNSFKIEGQEEIKIPYQESFTLYSEPEVPQYKIFPKSTIKSEQAQLPEYDSTNQKINNTKSDNKNNLINQSIYPYLKSVINSRSQYQNYSSFESKYYLYHLLVKQRINWAEEEQKINGEFKLGQQEYINTLKQSAIYSDFLLNFSLVLNSELSNDNSYEISYQGEDSGKIYIDIAIKPNDVSSNNPNKIGFVFVDYAIQNQDAQTNSQFVLPALTQMKIHMLEHTYGWKIFPIYYEQWIQLFSTSESKQIFIKKAINY